MYHISEKTYQNYAKQFEPCAYFTKQLEYIYITEQALEIPAKLKNKLIQLVNKLNDPQSINKQAFIKNFNRLVRDLKKHVPFKKPQNLQDLRWNSYHTFFLVCGNMKHDYEKHRDLGLANSGALLRPILHMVLGDPMWQDSFFNERNQVAA